MMNLSSKIFMIKQLKKKNFTDQSTNSI
jgi:hypothetical protein